MTRSLMEGEGFSVKEIMGKYEISDRQVKRDIEYIRDRLLAPVEYFRGKNKYLLDGEWKEALYFDEKLLMANALFDSFMTKIPVGEFVSSEIKNNVRAGLSDESQSIVHKITYRFPSVDVPDYKIFSVVVDAFKMNSSIEISYLKSTYDDMSYRTVEPVQLVNYQQAWYLYTFDHLSNSERIFHLSRIKTAKLTNTPITYSITKEELEEKINSGYGIFVSGDAQEYKIRFSYDAAYKIKSQVWHESQVLVENEDGSVDMIIKSFAPYELIAKMVQFGSLAKPIEPVSFVEEYKRTIKEIYDNFDN